MLTDEEIKTLQDQAKQVFVLMGELAEMEKTVSRLTNELKEARADIDDRLGK